MENEALPLSWSLSPTVDKRIGERGIPTTGEGASLKEKRQTARERNGSLHAAAYVLRTCSHRLSRPSSHREGTGSLTGPIHTVPELSEGMGLVDSRIWARAPRTLKTRVFGCVKMLKKKAKTGI